MFDPACRIPVIGTTDRRAGVTVRLRASCEDARPMERDHTILLNKANRALPAVAGGIDKTKKQSQFRRFWAGNEGGRENKANWGLGASR